MNLGDSGSLIVGAGFASSHEPTGFTAFGSRVNLQGWGESVATLGYDDLFLGDGNYNRSYTEIYSGTSSASAMVAGAAILTQQAAKQHFGSPFDAFELRELLRRTGTPQGPLTLWANIGPLPNLQGAIDRLDEADAALAAQPDVDNVFRLTIENFGPSWVRGRVLTLTAVSGSAVIVHRSAPQLNFARPFRWARRKHVRPLAAPGSAMFRTCASVARRRRFAGPARAQARQRCR